MDHETLERDLLKAHDEGNRAALIHLYTQAAEERELAQDIDAACFYLTHAFVFALEAGAPEADMLNKRLFDRGRAHRLTF